MVGLGHIAQVAVLPAFAHAENSELTALVSGHPKKLEAMGKQYGVERRYDYSQFDNLLRSGSVDAVYLALPNDLHRDFAVRAARAGLHVLSEKPLAVTKRDCREMVRAAEDAGVLLMTAYRLHFDPATLAALEVLRSGALGEIRFFNSTFSMQVSGGNIRVQKERGGGPLYDIGIYCLNAARQMFGAEPVEVFAMAASAPDPRFREIDEMVSATLRFPGARLATFLASFGASDTGHYSVVGTKGSLCLDPAYEYAEGLSAEITIGGRTEVRHFQKHDQFAAELVYFSNCIRDGKRPEPDGREGEADVRVIEALRESLRTGRPVRLSGGTHRPRMKGKQRIIRAPHPKPETVLVRPPHPD